MREHMYIMVELPLARHERFSSSAEILMRLVDMEMDHGTEGRAIYRYILEGYGQAEHSRPPQHIDNVTCRRTVSRGILVFF